MKNYFNSSKYKYKFAAVNDFLQMAKKNSSLCRVTLVFRLGFLHLGKRGMLMTFLFLFFSVSLFAQNKTEGEKSVHVSGGAVIISSDEDFNAYIDENSVKKISVNTTEGSKTYVFTNKTSFKQKPKAYIASKKVINKKQALAIGDITKKMAAATQKPKTMVAPLPKESTTFIYKSLGASSAASIPTYYSKIILKTETASSINRDFVSYLKISYYAISEVLYNYSETYSVRPPPFLA